MTVSRMMAVPCAALMLSACLAQTERDEFEGDRFGTGGGQDPGTGSYTDDGGGVDIPTDVPDTDQDEPSAGDAAAFCQVKSGYDYDLDKPPFKTPGGFWDQHGWAACGYIALINANIVSGADDANGAFEAAVRACLAAKGIDDEDLANGLSGAEMRSIADCKEQLMSDAGSPVTIEDDGFKGWFNNDLKDRCGDIQTALTDGGSATVTFRKDGKGHIMRVSQVECDEPSENYITLYLKDPNFPDGKTTMVVVDCDDEVIAVSPVHFWLEPGAKATAAMIETPDE